MEACGVVLGRVATFVDRRYAVLNSIDSITIVAELRFGLFRAHSIKTKSVATDPSVVSTNACEP